MGISYIYPFCSMIVPIIPSSRGFILSSQLENMIRTIIVYLMASSLRDAYHRVSSIHDFLAGLLYFPGHH